MWINQIFLILCAQESWKSFARRRVELVAKEREDWQEERCLRRRRGKVGGGRRRRAVRASMRIVPWMRLRCLLGSHSCKGHRTLLSTHRSGCSTTSKQQSCSSTRGSLRSSKVSAHSFTIPLLSYSFTRFFLLILLLFYYIFPTNFLLFYYTFSTPLLHFYYSFITFTLLLLLLYYSIIILLLPQIELPPRPIPFPGPCPPLDQGLAIVLFYILRKSMCLCLACICIYLRNIFILSVLSSNPRSSSNPYLPL